MNCAQNESLCALKEKKEGIYIYIYIGGGGGWGEWTRGGERVWYSHSGMRKCDKRESGLTRQIIL